MRHLLIAESRDQANSFVNDLERASCFEVIDAGQYLDRKLLPYWDVLLPNGRVDTINYINNGHCDNSFTNIGNIFRASNSFSTDEAFYYIRRNVYWTHDPLTAHWALFTKDDYIDFNPQPERLVFVQCMESIYASQKQIRKR